MSGQTTDSTDTVEKKRGSRTVYDQYGTEYELTGSIGSGGQGTVCTTQYPKVLVKVANLKASASARKGWVDRIRWIMRQDLGHLNIAFPQALVTKPWPGYVMELMENLIPLQELIVETQTAMMDGRGLQGFLETGGLARRFRILAKLARLLADLHAKGLAYGDLSPNNIFISKSVDEAEVWLIDSDNLTTSCRMADIHIHTQGYGAPEVVNGRCGINTLSDSWSFAVIAFELLSLIHPFKGDMVENGEPELQDLAYQGDFPWVDHPDDRSNESSSGLPRDIISTAKLRELFEQCFNASLKSQYCRPTMNAWAEALEAAEKLCIRCEECGSSFVYKPEKECPFCDHVQSDDNCMLLRHYLYSASLAKEEEVRSPWIGTGFAQVLSKSKTVTLYHSAPGSRLYIKSDALCHVKYDDNGLAITPVHGSQVILQNAETNAKESISREWFSPRSNRQNQRHMLHIISKKKKKTSMAHNVWHFIW